MYGAVVSEGSSSGKPLCTYHRMLSLSKARVIPIVDSAGSIFLCHVLLFTDQKNAFQLISTDKSFTVMADTPEEKEFWVHTFCLFLSNKQLMDLNEILKGERRGSMLMLFLHLDC